MSLYGVPRGTATMSPSPPDPELSTGRLLTMDWLDGTRAADLQGCRSGRRATVSRGSLFEAWWTPLIKIGVIHGDPHLGNYSFSDDAERLNLLDFGCVRVFPPAFVGGVVKLFRAMIADDRDGEAEAYRGLGLQGPDGRSDGRPRHLGALHLRAAAR